MQLKKNPEKNCYYVKITIILILFDPLGAGRVWTGDKKLLSKRIKNLKPSATMALGARAEKLKQQGVDVISLTLGEPTKGTPDFICSAGIQAIKEGHTRYTPASGCQNLKKAIQTNTKKNLDLDYKLSQITVSIGAKFVLFSALQSLCDPEDEVLVPVPYWVSYPAQVELADGFFKPLPTKAQEGFKLKPEVLESHITPRSKILILNSPNNPTGSAFTHEELKALGEILKKHPHVYVLSDDIYNHLYFEGFMAPHLLQACPALKDRVLAINAVSKNYAMTGWRVGWAVGPEQIISAMSRFQSQSVSCAVSLAQEASATALNKGDEELKKTKAHLQNAKERALSLFQKIEGLTIHPPAGAFYFWIGVEKLYGLSWKGGVIRSSKDFVEALLQEKAVLCVPGEAFGFPGYLRLHFAVEKNRLKEATSRIADFISSLKPTK